MVTVTGNFLTGYCFSLVTVTINFIIMERKEKKKKRRWLLLLIGYCYYLSLVTLTISYFLLFLICYYYYFSLFTVTVSHCLGSLFFAWVFAWVFVLTLCSYHCTLSMTRVTCPKKQARWLCDLFTHDVESDFYLWFHQLLRPSKTSDGSLDVKSYKVS